MTASTPDNGAPAALPETPPAYLEKDVPHAEFKAALLLLLLAVLVLGSALYLMAARGAFQATQTLRLEADDAEDVTVGMDLTFSGFPIGRVQRIELSPVGKARMIIDVPRKDAHWLRSSSIFTLERPLVGGARLRAFSGILSDPPLPDGALRSLLVGDTGAEIPRVLAAVKELVQNLGRLSAPDSALDGSLNNIKTATAKINGATGAMGVLAGDDAGQLLARSNALLLSLGAMASKTDHLMASLDERVFGKAGVMNDTQAGIVQLNALLLDVRASVRKVDAVLEQAQAVGANARAATSDLGALRLEVEANLRHIEQLVNQINRKWPFAVDTQIKLP